MRLFYNLFSSVLMVTLLIVTSCKETRNNSSQPAPQSYQRFLPVQTETFGGGLALDTKTGQLCRTWDLQLDFGVVKATPLCKDLYEGALESDGVPVTAPNGKTYIFPDKAHADAFKKEAGIQ
jgi:hypothetical protein